MSAAEYQLVSMNQSGVIDTSFRLRFADDEAAMAHARALRHAGRVEVWIGKREVGIVPPTIEARGPGVRTRASDR